MSIALIIIFGVILISAFLGIYAGRRVKMDLENWTVGGRRFGIILIWLLMAGEVYTTFAFLGASGWAYSKGAPSFYILIYATLGFVVSFFILPILWRLGKRHSLHTQPDYFIKRYDSRMLGAFVALIGVFSIIPYLQLQLTGLGFIVEAGSKGAIGSKVAIFISFVLTCIFVYTSGIRGVAWVAIVKDILMILAVGIVGIGVPVIYFGGIGKMFKALADQYPQHLVFPGTTGHMDVIWVMSTILLSGLGAYMWPHVFGSAFSAKSDTIIKRNAIIMPFYQIALLFVFFVGFTAVLILPNLKNPDTALLALVSHTYPSWFLGFVGAAGAVTAMVPSAVLILFASTLITKNVYRAVFNPNASDTSIMRLSRLMVIVITTFAMVFAFFFPNELVNLLIYGYDGVCQFFPGVVLGLFWRRTSKVGVLSGLVVGLGLVVALIASGNDPFLGMNAGFVGLVLNLIVTILVTKATKPVPNPIGWPE